MVTVPRILFLDDDPVRAETFQSDHPGAVWVQTVPECIDRLAEPWDEVHLDHDLGGEAFVDHEREDCGMAVVRWLCQQRREHLLGTRFTIHSHNSTAASLMTFQLQVSGYSAEAYPFGMPPTRLNPDRLSPGKTRCPALCRLLDWLAGRSKRPAPPPRPHRL